MSKHIQKRKLRFREGLPLPPPPVSDARKDFGKLLHDYRKLEGSLNRKPLYRRPRLFLLLFMLAVIAFLVYRAIEEEKLKKHEPLPLKQDTLIHESKRVIRSDTQRVIRRTTRFQKIDSVQGFSRDTILEQDLEKGKPEQ